MIGLGLLIAFFGYAIMYWGIEGIQGITQPRFMSYVFPWVSSNSGAIPSKNPDPNAPPGPRGPIK